MKIAVLSLFPEMFDSFLSASILGRARTEGLLDVRPVDIRPYSDKKHKNTDDYPFGGGAGMVMMAQPIVDAVRDLRSQGYAGPCIYLSPRGTPLTQKKVVELSAKEGMILLCGHYEGVDQRFIDECVDEEISIGDFVLTGGEIPAMAVADAVCRMVPRVLPDEEAFTAESHWEGLLEHPQYTRPENWRGREVPAVLLSGHHANIEAWRREMSLRRTKADRPDLFARFQPKDKQDKKILGRILQDGDGTV